MNPPPPPPHHGTSADASTRVSVVLPQFGEASASATVLGWMVEVGNTVTAGQDLCEVETEKATMTVTAPVAGVLEERVASPGDRFAVGAVLAYISASAGSADATGSTAPAATAKPISKASTASSATKPGTTRVQGSPPRQGAAGLGWLSPRVRARLAEWGLAHHDLSGLRGSGEGGRLTAADVERFLAQLEATPSSQADSMRLAVSDSMQRSWSRPLATVGRHLHCDPLMEHRRTLSSRPSLTIYALRALALALQGDSSLASRLVGGRLLHPTGIHIACAVEQAGGVLTPTLEAVDSMGLDQLTAAYEKLIESAQTGRMHAGPPAIATVTNYGTLGLDWATAIPSPDQSFILGLGAVRNTPDWNPKSKSWDRIRACELTLTFDHRVGDGAAAAKLLNRIAALIENPSRLV